MPRKVRSKPRPRAWSKVLVTDERADFSAQHLAILKEAGVQTDQPELMQALSHAADKFRYAMWMEKTRTRPADTRCALRRLKHSADRLLNHIQELDQISSKRLIEACDNRLARSAHLTPWSDGDAYARRSGARFYVYLRDAIARLSIGADIAFKASPIGSGRQRQTAARNLAIQVRDALQRNGVACSRRTPGDVAGRGNEGCAWYTAIDICAKAAGHPIVVTNAWRGVPIRQKSH